MNKQELVQKIATDADIAKSAADRAVTSIINNINSALASGEEVRLAGLGVFTVRTRAARMGRNPSTGEQTPIPAKRAVKFTAAKAMKDAVE